MRCDRSDHRDIAGKQICQRRQGVPCKRSDGQYQIQVIYLEKMAAMLRFTERQATAILEMRLYRLIGLEIEALQKEHEETLKNIARYEDILNNYDSMAGVIMEELDHYKKEYGRKRRLRSRMLREAVFEEKKDRRAGCGLPHGPVWICKDGGRLCLRTEQGGGGQ